MNDSVSVFSAHADDYDAQRQRLVPSLELFYGTAVDLLALRGGPLLRVLDLGAGTGLMSRAVLGRYPEAEVVMLDGSPEMLAHAAERLRGRSARTVTADMRDPLPDGPFDAVVSALAIHHLEHAEKQELFARVHDVLRPGGAFVNAEHVGGPTPELERTYRHLWTDACTNAGAASHEIDHALERMKMDRTLDVDTQLAWMRQAGFDGCDCFFKHLHFAVLAGWA